MNDEVVEPQPRLRHAAETHAPLMPLDYEACGQVPRCGIGRQDETADALVPPCPVQHAGEDQMQPRHAAAGDPVLGAVQDIAVAILPRGGPHLGRGTARLGLRDADRGLVPRQHQRRAERLLRLGAVGHHGADAAHIGLDHDARGQRAGARDLLHHHGHVEKARPLTAQRAGDGHAHDPGLRQFADIRPAIGAGPVPFGGPRGKAGGKLPRPADQSMRHAGPSPLLRLSEYEAPRAGQGPIPDPATFAMPRPCAAAASRPPPAHWPGSPAPARMPQPPARN